MAKNGKQMAVIRNAKSRNAKSAKPSLGNRRDEMKRQGKRTVFAASMVTILPLTGCLTTPPASSSAIEITATAERETVCAALLPERIERSDYDQSPPAIQEWITDTVLTWAEVCDAA